MTEYFFCWRNLQEFPIKTASNKEVVNKTEEPKKEVVKKTEVPKKEVAKNTGPELVVGGYFVKSDKGKIYGMKVFSSSPGEAVVMLYDQDDNPLFKQNETAAIFDQERAKEWGGDTILIQSGVNNIWLKIMKF